jgi:hypothetical protein
LSRCVGWGIGWSVSGCVSGCIGRRVGRCICGRVGRCIGRRIGRSARGRGYWCGGSVLIERVAARVAQLSVVIVKFDVVLHTVVAVGVGRWTWCDDVIQHDLRSSYHTRKCDGVPRTGHEYVCACAARHTGQCHLHASKLYGGWAATIHLSVIIYNPYRTGKAGRAECDLSTAVVRWVCRFICSWAAGWQWNARSDRAQWSAVRGRGRRKCRVHHRWFLSGGRSR